MWSNGSDGTVSWTSNRLIDDSGGTDVTFGSICLEYELDRYTAPVLCRNESESRRVIRSARELLASMREAALRRCYCPAPFIGREPMPLPLWTFPASIRGAPRPREPGIGVRNWRKESI